MVRKFSATCLVAGAVVAGTVGLAMPAAAGVATGPCDASFYNQNEPANNTITPSNSYGSISYGTDGSSYVGVQGSSSDGTSSGYLYADGSGVSACTSSGSNGVTVTVP